MNQSSQRQGFPVGNPIANVLVVIIGALAIAASIVLGFVAFVVLSSIVLIFAAVIGIRVWWFRRKLAKSDTTTDPGQAAKRPVAGVIEGEFIVVEEDEPRSRG